MNHPVERCRDHEKSFAVRVYVTDMAKVYQSRNAASIIIHVVTETRSEKWVDMISENLKQRTSPCRTKTECGDIQKMNTWLCNQCRTAQHNTEIGEL